MSAIRERTVLCVIDLPKKLTSRRNLHAHFSEFGEVKNVSVKKELRSGMIQFSSHFDAQAAKTQGLIFEGEPLNIFWSESTTLDPRAREKQDYDTHENDPLWQEDDKECFGVENVQPSLRDERKQSAKDLIKQHLKLPGVKNRLGINKKVGEVNKLEVLVSSKSLTKLGRSDPKITVPLKKSLLTNANKQKVVRKERGTINFVTSEQEKKSVLQDQASKLTASVIEGIDLKQKLALLDERDKLIRKETVQDSNIKTAVAIKGTCPDMCPERERILRQCGHAVATYEMLPGTCKMDENRAVKEYVRSSADQEVPLPHDLRPEPVLSLTMNYLITNIIVKGDDPGENKAVWYSFCWNRLRSIRKDIIVQQLCDMETVKILEQCARFHISCYDHMCGADVGGFDDKINTQILMDCLQSLRHMYEDFAKHNVTCPNEAEFYSYLILLKLTSGDVMWEYQQYSVEIQRSPHMQFAIEAYTAFKNNMYSRYFSLVKRASYLTACLMQRFFDEVRTQALKTMLKAYCLPGKTVGLSSSFLVSSLKFDSHKNAVRFCEREEVDVKVSCDGNEQDIQVSTSCFLIKEKRLPIIVAVVGEGNPLPIYIPHQVHSSFDEYGKLNNSLPVASSDDVPGFTASPYSEEEQSEVNFEEIVQQPAFKFSLSPTKVNERFFEKSSFSHQTSPDLQLIQQCLDKKESTLSVISNQDSRNDQEQEMVEDFEQDRDYEENKLNQKCSPTSNDFQPFFVSQTVPSRTTQHGVQQQFLLPSVTSSDIFKMKSDNFIGLPNLLPGKDFTKKAVHNVEFFKDNKESFSFSIPKSASTFPFSRDNILNANTSFETNKDRFENRGNTFKFDISTKDLIDNLKPQTIYPVNKDVTTEMDVQFPEELDQTHLKSGNIYDEKEGFHLEKDTKATEQTILLERLLKEKADEERLKMEEIKKVEMERRTKKIQEQKVLQALKKDLRERLKIISARKCARHWKERVEKLKKTRADFPMLIQLSVSKHLSAWGTINSVPTNSVSQRARDKRNRNKVISQLLQSGITESCRYIGTDLAETLAISAAKTMRKGYIKPVYWKLGVSVPWAIGDSSELSVFNQLMKRWCTQSFYKEENTNLGSVEHVITSLGIPVNISIHISDDLQSSYNLQAMDSLIFVVLNESESENMCLQRLRSLVTCQVKSGELSVAVMNIGTSKIEQVLKMEMEKLYEQNLIAHWTVNTWSSPDSIMESLNFLTTNISVVSHICATPLEMLVKKISEEFFDSLNAGQYSSVGLMNSFKSPNNVIQLYNTLLTKLEDLLMSSKLEKYFSFPEEFQMHVPLNESGGPELLCGKRYDDSYKSQISKKINSLRLEEFSKWPAKSPNRLVKMLKTYCMQVHDVNVFPQIIRMLDLPDESNILQHLKQVSWLNIVEIWAQCSIRHTFSAKEKRKRLFVIFNKNDVQRMLKKQWWLKLPAVENYS